MRSARRANRCQDQLFGLVRVHDQLQLTDRIGGNGWWPPRLMPRAVNGPAWVKRETEVRLRGRPPRRTRFNEEMMGAGAKGAEPKMSDAAVCFGRQQQVSRGDAVKGLETGSGPDVLGVRAGLELYIVLFQAVVDGSRERRPRLGAFSGKIWASRRGRHSISTAKTGWCKSGPTGAQLMSALQTYGGASALLGSRALYVHTCVARPRRDGTTESSRLPPSAKVNKAA